MNEENNHKSPAQPDPGTARPDTNAGDTATIKAGPGLLRRLWLVLSRSALAVLVVFTLYVTAGRLLMPALTTQKTDIELRLGRLLGIPVSIGNLEGEWFRFSPGFAVSNLVLQLDPMDPTTRFAVAEAKLTLDIRTSLLGRQPSLSRVELKGIELSLDQLENGRWTLRGLASGGRDYQDMLLDLLFDTPLIVVNEANVLLRLRDGHELALSSLYLQLQNRGEDHNVSLQFRPGAENNPVLMQVALQGDPRNRFEGRVWAEAPLLQMQAQVAPFLPDSWHLDSLTSSGLMWATFNESGLLSLSGRLDETGIQSSTGTASQPIDLANATLLFAARRNPAEQEEWLVDVQELAFDWNNTPWAVPVLQLRLPLAATAPWQLRAQTLELPLLSAITASLPLSETALSALQTLQPQGELRQVLLESDRSGAYPATFSLKANFAQLAVAAWRGAPAGTGLEGYVEVDADSGLVEMDATDVTLFLPNLFKEPWSYHQLNARVNWANNAEGFRVTSSPIMVRNEFLQGRVQFELNSELRSPEPMRSDFTLFVGMDYMDLATRAAYLPTMPRIANTMGWLDTALESGRISHSGFVLRTPTGRNPGLASTTHASWYEVDTAHLQFLPQWPPVDISTALVKVQDNKAMVTSTAASIAGIAVHQVQALVSPLTSGGSQLQLDVAARSDTGNGISFLRTTPIRDTIGTTLDNWEASGNLDLGVKLGIPLGNTEAERQIAVEVQSRDSTLRLSDQALEISALNGALSWQHDSGLQAAGLTARMFAAPVELGIDTLEDGGVGFRTIRVNSAGRASIAALREWEGQAPFVRKLLDFTEGEMDYTATLDLPGAGSGKQPHLQVQSDLFGVTSHFPAPFAKTAQSTDTLQLDMDFNTAGNSLQLRYSDWLSGDLILGATGIDRGQLYFGSLNQNFTIRQTDASASGLLINGELPMFDFAEWRRVAERLADDSGTNTGFKDYLRLIDVDIASLNVMDQVFTDINVQVQFRDGAWQIYGKYTLLDGTVLLPEDTGTPWEVTLDYLRFPPRPVPAPDEEGNTVPETEERDLLENVDPTGLPAFTFQTGELSIGEHNLGAWSLKFTPTTTGAFISDFRMQEATSFIAGITTADTEAGSGAVIDWRYRNGVHSSHYAGVFAAGDLAAVMPKWGHDANIVSRQALFTGALSWPGSPLAFNLKKASGNLTMAIDNGRFVDIDSGSSRLMGVFNFDALVRRLELDFSDLYQRGFTYDTIRGDLDFMDGVVHTTTPLIIDGPSSRLNINGEISLAEETIAADMQVRIPLSQNISLLAGLLGAWPIAVSTYIASKIFAEQVEEFTTIIYRLEGPWADPQAGFEAPEEAAPP